MRGCSTAQDKILNSIFWLLALSTASGWKVAPLRYCFRFRSSTSLAIFSLPISHASLKKSGPLECYVLYWTGSIMLSSVLLRETNVAMRFSRSEFEILEHPLPYMHTLAPIVGHCWAFTFIKQYPIKSKPVPVGTVWKCWSSHFPLCLRTIQPEMESLCYPCSKPRLE